jgi:hypothetical protein
MREREAKAAEKDVGQRKETDAGSDTNAKHR